MRTVSLLCSCIISLWLLHYPMHCLRIKFQRKTNKKKQINLTLLLCTTAAEKTCSQSCISHVVKGSLLRWPMHSCLPSIQWAHIHCPLHPYNRS